MTKLRSIVTLATLLLVAPAVAVGQREARIPIPESPPAKIEGKFAIARFDQDDRTTVTLAHQKAGGENACGIWVSAGYTFQGKPVTKPASVYISFVRDSADEPRMLKSETERTLKMTIDGEVVLLGVMRSVKEVITGYTLATQGLLLPLPYVTFRRIADAKKVEVQLGPLQFFLTETNLRDFRDLERRMGS